MTLPTPGAITPSVDCSCASRVECSTIGAAGAGCPYFLLSTTSLISLAFSPAAIVNFFAFSSAAALTLGSLLGDAHSVGRFTSVAQLPKGCTGSFGPHGAATIHARRRTPATAKRAAPGTRSCVAGQLAERRASRPQTPGHVESRAHWTDRSSSHHSTRSAVMGSKREAFHAG
jgi:hypothetical protein